MKQGIKIFWTGTPREIESEVEAFFGSDYTKGKEIVDIKYQFVIDQGKMIYSIMIHWREK